MNINPFDLLKSAQAMQEKMGEMQAKLAALTAVGSSGGGMVKVTVNGQFDVLRVEIEPDAVDPKDIPMLQDLVKAACSDAMSKIREEIRLQVSSVAGDLQLPPGMLGV